MNLIDNANALNSAFKNQMKEKIKKAFWEITKSAHENNK